MENMRQNLLDSFPTQQQAFEGFVQDYKWKQFKKKCLDDIFSKRKKTTKTSYSDVPQVVRQDQCYYLE